MVRKSKSQKKAERDAEFEKRLESLPELPEDSYEDEDRRIFLKDGTPLPDGCYRIEDGGVLLYEYNFLNGKFDLM